MAEPATVMPAHRLACRLVPLRPGEPCGDAVAHHELPAGDGAPTDLLLAIVDGLGHGVDAAQAADAALALLAEQPSLPLPVQMARLDAGLTGTRGAAVGLTRIEHTARGLSLLHAGIGNTRTLRWRQQRMLRLSSQYGIVGGGLSVPVVVSRTDLAPGDWLLMFSDGLDEMIELPVCLPEWQRDPATLCDHLLARWRLAPDDAGVMVVQVAGG
jgi:Stage II sporulation protein E (SpoIIE)